MTLFTKGFSRTLFTAALLLAGTMQAQATEKVLVFAPPALTNALTELGQTYDKTHDTKVEFSFACAASLARQIVQGAPAQIYLSANQKWMKYLIDNHAVTPKTPVTLLTANLVMIAPKSSPLQQVDLSAKWDLRAALHGSKMAVCDPEHAPAGRYAQQALQHFDLWQQAKPELAYAANVRKAVALVESKESALGIVYDTDAKSAKAVKIVATFPQDSHQPIQYPMTLIGATPSAAATDFYHYLQTPAAQQVFTQYGFGIAH